MSLKLIVVCVVFVTDMTNNQGFFSVTTVDEDDDGENEVEENDAWFHDKIQNADSGLICGSQRKVLFDPESIDLSLLDDEYDGGKNDGENNNSELWTATSTDHVNCSKNDETFAFESFREELDQIANHMVSHINIDELFARAKECNYKVLQLEQLTPVKSNYTNRADISHEENKESAQSPFAVINHNNFKAEMAESPQTTNVGYRIAGTNSASKRSEPPTPVKTPVNIGKHQPLRRQLASDEKSRQTSYYGEKFQQSRGNFKKTHREHDEFARASTANVSLETSKSGLQGIITRKANKSQSILDADKMKISRTVDSTSLLDSMRETLELQEARIRTLEIENERLKDELRRFLKHNTDVALGQQESGYENNYCTSTPSMQLESPPFVVLSTTLRDEIPTSQDAFHPLRSRTTHNSTDTDRNDRESPLHSTSQLHNSRSIEDRYLYSPSGKHRRGLPSRKGRRNPNSQIDAASDEFEFLQQQFVCNDTSDDDLEYRLSDRTAFSPGTQFVEKLSRVVSIQEGHYAPLSRIMDKHFDRVASLPPRHRFDD